MRVLIPYTQGGLLAELHSDARVIREEYTDTGIAVEAVADEPLFRRFLLRLGEKAVSRIG